MQLLNCWGQSVSMIAVMAIATTGIISPAGAGTKSEQPTKIAQTIVGQCRAAKYSTPIFSERAATSPALRLLATSDQVTLSENTSTDGLIGVSAPSKGYVFAANLKLCGTATVPTGSLCRQVISPPEGLFIRTEADANAPLANPPGVGFMEKVTLTTDPATVKEGAQGRIWVKIAQPAAGWVSNGIKGSGVGNLTYCK
jgi:hypothetical protein